ncbi:rRNA-proCES [Forsythia ovata]|uniref:rRNA-proCES n=1 Tax=Forsythia ovata TaxID=205694 RepID=A0ABD1NZ33_9LAMI
MKVKKQKRHRRAVRFFTACFGFREPFKVLCDGTFVYHLLANRITPADTALANTLGATVKIFTTRCCKALASHILNRLMLPDAELRKKMQEIPGVPVIYALRNSLFLERPSGLQHQFAKAAEEERSHMTKLEYKMLKKKKKVAIEEAADAFDANESDVDHMLDTVVKANIKRDRTNVKDQVRFNRNKAKGPNPLSCRKKKTDGKKKTDRNKNASSEKMGLPYQKKFQMGMSMPSPLSGPPDTSWKGKKNGQRDTRNKGRKKHGGIVLLANESIKHKNTKMVMDAWYSISKHIINEPNEAMFTEKALWLPRIQIKFLLKRNGILTRSLPQRHFDILLSLLIRSAVLSVETSGHS